MNILSHKKIIAGALLALGMTFIGCDLTSPKSDSGALAITTQPANKTVADGDSGVLFSITATGTGTVKYKWIVTLGGVVVDSTDTMSTLSGNVAYKFNGAVVKCIVTDSKTSVTSSTATLTVTQVAVTSRSFTAGAQSNTTNGSFLDIDGADGSEDYLSGELPGSLPYADIDLFYGYSTSDNSAAIYSPNVAKAGVNGSAGFTIAQALNPANTTEIRTTAATWASIINKSQVDSLWSSGTVVSTGKLAIANNTMFLAKSNKGRVVLMQASGVVSSASGTASFTCKAKF